MDEESPTELTAVLKDGPSMTPEEVDLLARILFAWWLHSWDGQDMGLKGSENEQEEWHDRKGQSR